MQKCPYVSCNAGQAVLPLHYNACGTPRLSWGTLLCPGVASLDARSSGCSCLYMWSSMQRPVLRQGLASVPSWNKTLRYDHPVSICSSLSLSLPPLSLFLSVSVSLFLSYALTLVEWLPETAIVAIHAETCATPGAGVRALVEQNFEIGSLCFYLLVYVLCL
jgi:hypothetical protein